MFRVLGSINVLRETFQQSVDVRYSDIGIHFCDTFMTLQQMIRIRLLRINCTDSTVCLRLLFPRTDLVILRGILNFWFAHANTLSYDLQVLRFFDLIPLSILLFCTAFVLICTSALSTLSHTDTLCTKLP